MTCVNAYNTLLEIWRFGGLVSKPTNFYDVYI